MIPRRIGQVLPHAQIALWGQDPGMTEGELNRLKGDPGLPWPSLARSGSPGRAWMLPEPFDDLG